MKGLYIAPLVAATLLPWRLFYNGKTDLCVSDTISILSCQQLQSEYNRIQQYIDNGVQTQKYRYGCWSWTRWWLGTRWLGIRSIYFCKHGTVFFNENTELSRVLGQQEAIVQAAQFKNCPIIVRKRPINSQLYITIC